MAVLKLLLILAGIIVGIRQKFFVGYLLCLAGVATPLLFGKAAPQVLEGIWYTLTSPAFWRLFGAIVIVTILGHLLKRMGALDRLTSAARGLAGGKRTATIILPAVVGMMPMPGGAVLSAPLVGEVLKEDQKSPEFLSAVNYWFRHVMEFFWPLYPGLILAAGIVGLPLPKFSALGLVMTAAMIIIGYIYFLRGIHSRRQSTETMRSLAGIMLAIWPVFLAVFLSLVLAIDIVISLAVSVLLTVILNRSSWRLFWPVVKEVVAFRLFFMVFGILLFKDMVALSGAVAGIPAEVARLGIPPAAVIMVVAFLCGLLSGMVAAFVGLSFPILAGFLYVPNLDLGNIFLTFLCGYTGMILSPTHFCLLLTAEHFRADLGKVYRSFLPPLLLLVFFGLILYLLGYPWGLIRP